MLLQLEFNKDRDGSENVKESSSNSRETGAGGSSSGGNAGSGGERQSKRARRTKPDNVIISKKVRMKEN